MNSYPQELLVQLAPVMFVAGLDVEVTTSTSSSTESDPDLSEPPPTPSKSRPNEFEILAERLRDGFAAQRRPAIWQSNSNDEKTFTIIPVDKNVRFPPRKLPPTDDGLGGHSPLSPLTPASPLYPDGLIAPIWIRKHTSMVPSVFVYFLKLYEHPKFDLRSPLDAPDAEKEKEKEAEERKKDLELAAEVALRKKSTNERGIKLTVVLMASRQMLDDESLDQRLTFIRRQSGLDSRAALFVLSPVSEPELLEFIKSLQDALFDSALEYYTNHSKRVRRKRNRHQTVSSYTPQSNVPGAKPSARPLRSEGWTVRYEYKMACFAEFRGEDEVALKHYLDAYSTLIIMFGSTAILPPRTKRWAEAKVLADTINVKVCKLYLYNDEHSLALSHHNTHVGRFADFSRGWGIGEETFEFWSWMARQYRIFAELVEQGTHFSLTIPTHGPKLPAASAATSPEPGVLSSRFDGHFGVSNPSQALHHPGYYFYMAAKYTEYRRERFLAMKKKEEEASGSELSSTLANELKVDHLASILELYTKAYELFKKYTPAKSGAAQNQQTRMTHFIAHAIAQNYRLSGKLEMAVKFFERIAKTFRREKWGALLAPLLLAWRDCAGAMENYTLHVQLTLELITLKTSLEQKLDEELIEILKNQSPTSKQAIVLDFSESAFLLTPSLLFWTERAFVAESIPFQFTLSSSQSLRHIPFTSLTINFTNGIEPITIYHGKTQPDIIPQPINLIHLGNLSTRNKDVDFVADLGWSKGTKLVFTGSVSSDVPTTMTIDSIQLNISHGDWNIELPYSLPPEDTELTSPHQWYSSSRPGQSIPVVREDASFVDVQPRPHAASIEITQSSPAYIGELYPIKLAIVNTNNEPLLLTLDVLLQPVAIGDESAVNEIVIEDQQSTTMIKGVDFGIIQPGQTVEKTLYILCRGEPGDRVLDVSSQSRLLKDSSVAEPVASSDSPVEDPDLTETLQTITIPTEAPFKISHDIAYKHTIADRPAITALDVEDEQPEQEAVVSSTLVCQAKSLIIDDIELVSNEKSLTKVIDSSLSELALDLPLELDSGDEYRAACRVQPLNTFDVSIVSVAAYSVSWRRISSDGSYGSATISRLELPACAFGTSLPSLVALLFTPSSVRLHTPFLITIKVRNSMSTKHSAYVTVHLQLPTDEPIQWAITGLRSARIPILLPGAEQVLTWRLVALECGFVSLPRIRVIDRRAFKEDEEREAEVDVIDVRLDGTQGGDTVRTSDTGSILVLP